MVIRIKKLIDKQKLTATQFAGEIGVQRSAVSHLLSGRNKPSLDFMLKIKNRFPEVNLDWLLLGEGKMMLASQNEKVENQNSQEKLFRDETNSKIEERINLDNEVKETEMPFSMAKSEDSPTYNKVSLDQEQSPQKVILLYSDNTFKVFNTQ